MTPLRQRLIEELALRGYSDKTKEAYVHAVAGLATHYGRAPDQLKDEETRAYLVQLHTQSGKAALASVGFRRWLRFCAVAFPVLLGVYVLGYFVLMNRHRPTSPAGEFVRFESSLRFAPREWVYKAQTPYKTPWGSVTTWNIIYQPMDRLWFHYFPRSQQERERLREVGYYYR